MLGEDDLLKHVLETTQAGYWDWNAQHNTKYLSPRFKKMFGYQDHELENDPATWAKIVHPDDAPRVEAAYEQHVASRGKIPFQIEARYYHKNGSVVWVQCQGKVIAWDEAGNPIRFVGSHIDITAQKQAETELKHYQRALTSLKKIATNAHLSYDEQINAALKVVSQYLDLPIGIVSRIRGEVYEVVNVYTNEEMPLSKGQVFALGNTYCSVTYQQDRALGLHHVGQSDQATHPCYSAMKLETYVGAPVRVRGQRYGTVNFSAPTPRPKPFSQYDLEFIEILASWVGYSVEKREISKTLEVSQKKARAVFENARDAIMLVDHDSLEITDCNQMAIDLYELDGREELIGRRGIDFHRHLFSGEQYQGYRALRYAGDFFSTEVEYVTKRGNKFWGNLSVFVFSLEDRLFQWVRVVDVSEARHRERELQTVKETLSRQARELQEVNEETRSINDSLEFLVQERTAALEERNRQLADFAFLNAHKMRGPLARILGLIDVLRFTDSREQEKEFLQHIIQSAEELDQVIKTAAATLVTPDYAQEDSRPKKLN